MMNQIKSEEMKIAIVDLKRKRKLQAEQLGLPKPKHKFLSRSLTCDAAYMFDESPEGNLLHPQMIKGKPEDESHHESMKHSINFARDSDSTMTVCGESNLESEHSIPCLIHRPTTSSASWISNTLMDSHCSADSLAAEKSKQTLSRTDELQLLGNIEQDSVDGNDGIEDFADKEYEELLYSNEGSQNMFVLSSGRWTVNSESGSETSTRKPTIDQEFEQYFSMLMM